MENIQNQLSFQEIFKQSFKFFERNLKNLLFSFLSVSIAISCLFFLPDQLKTLLISTLTLILVVEIYKTERVQEEFTFAKALAALKANAFIVLALSVSFGVINLIGLLLLIIPGIYAIVTLQFAVWSYLFKPDLKFFESIQHSISLTKGRFWSIIKINFLSAVVFFIIGIAIFFASFILTGLGFSVGQGLVIYLVALPVTIIGTVFQLFFFLRAEETYSAQQV